MLRRSGALAARPSWTRPRCKRWQNSLESVRKALGQYVYGKYGSIKKPNLTLDCSRKRKTEDPPRPPAAASNHLSFSMGASGPVRADNVPEAARDSRIHRQTVGAGLGPSRETGARTAAHHERFRQSLCLGRCPRRGTSMLWRMLVYAGGIDPLLPWGCGAGAILIS